MSQVYISIGSNIEKEKNIPSAIRSLEATFGNMELSSLYLCESLGFDGPDFYNMVVKIETDKTVEELVFICKQMELDHGRDENAKKFTPRPLDLDILLYDDQIMETPALIPRPEIKEYAFVLWPLAEIAGDKQHPVCQSSFNDLWLHFDASNQKIEQKPFKF